MKQFVQSAAIGHSKWQNQASKADGQVLNASSLEPSIILLFSQRKNEDQRR